MARGGRWEETGLMTGQSLGVRGTQRGRPGSWVDGILHWEPGGGAGLRCRPVNACL